jgi:hypothetical protein
VSLPVARPAEHDAPSGGVVAGSVSSDESPGPGRARVGLRDAYHFLVNIDEHPEVLPLAQDYVVDYLRRVVDEPPGRPSALAALLAQTDEAAALDRSLEQILTASATAPPWIRPDGPISRRQALHYFTQYAPTALVDGCWLQCGLRVATAHTTIGAHMTAMYVHQVRAYGEDLSRHFVGDYRAVFARLGSPLEEVSSRSLVDRVDLLDANFELPVLLLCIAQFPRTFLPELLGVHLAWQYLGLTSIGPTLIRDVCAACDLPPFGENLVDETYLDKARRMASGAVNSFLSGVGPEKRAQDSERVALGATLLARSWMRWLDRARATAPDETLDPRHEMLAMLRRKAPHAFGYHANKRLGDKKIDDYFAPGDFDFETLLDRLAAAPWVKPGDPDRSPLVRRLVEFGGPMHAVFSPLELEVMRDWIRSLASDAGAVAARRGRPVVPVAAEEPPARPMWTREAFRRRSEARHGGCSTRDLYHHLLNVELAPDILPIAERFARDRLERAMASLRKGERPIPSLTYKPEALEQWVFNKHREQVDSYRPLDGAPRVSKEAFVESTVQLAPLILIDGGWLQGMASASIIHTTIGRMLFHVFCEEVGLGNAAEHHANIYRDLLHAMGEDAPPVESREFAHWPRLKDASFEVPALWLSLSCFPRHFMPEILGLNLAVELAGVGGPYMEARDTLRYYKLPTLFVTVHNAADNVSVGHAAWAMNAIKKYMDEVTEREGPHRIDDAWHRIWTGVRSTLPQIGRLRLMAHRIGRRFFGPIGAGPAPVIFPS